MRVLLPLSIAILLLGSLAPAREARGVDSWQEDFKHQPVSRRPALEVSYTDASRQAFQIVAERYQLMGQLVQPHLLVDRATREPWLWFEMRDAEGTLYSSRHSAPPSRINLYRRGPYFCEIHWLDLGLATAQGQPAPLKGDLALYCYPEKILAEVTWHGTGPFPATAVSFRGVVASDMACATFADKTRQRFHLPLFGEEPPLSDHAFHLQVGEVPFQYNARKGCYVVGTYTSGSFQREFYETPNRYETATFSLTNDAVRRKITICHESARGGAIVEGGVVLDDQGQVLPLVVQVSKNFAGEKEEKFYNPQDTPFSETFFPLYLEPDEKVTLTSLHLYQNWGRHMTKHWSSLGAWMDYFHSSTGVTETTCYVPFKFAGLGGVSIADFRAMSQEAFWSGQPQHDNLAGHSFLSFFDGQAWQHLVYEGTVYRSTGPNWFDIQLNYRSADGRVRVRVDTWETPQVDELRSFFKARYEVLKPLTIEDPRANFRLLEITSAIQHLRFTQFAASGTPDRRLDPNRAPFPVKGHALPTENAFLALYGDTDKRRGSNAIVVRRFKGPAGITPAASVQWGRYRQRLAHDGAPNTRLLLVPDVSTLTLKPGDVFEIDGYWLPYGPLEQADTPRQELALFGQDAPRVTQVIHGDRVSDLPVTVRARENQAQFRIQGGRDLIPVIVNGLTTWERPRLWKKEKGTWRHLSHARNSDHDGYQVYSEAGGTFGAVFLVHSDAREQALRLSVGERLTPITPIPLAVPATSPQGLPVLTVGAGHDGHAVSLVFPRREPTVTWQASEGRSLWFQSEERNGKRGARVSPHEEDLDLEYWWQHQREDTSHPAAVITLDTGDSEFADPDGSRTWALGQQGWVKAESSCAGARAIAVQSRDGRWILAMAWNRSRSAMTGNRPGIELPSVSAVGKRVHVRGKLYLMETDLDVMADRIRKETLPIAR